MLVNEERGVRSRVPTVCCKKEGCLERSVLLMDCRSGGRGVRWGIFVAGSGRLAARRENQGEMDTVDSERQPRKIRVLIHRCNKCGKANKLGTVVKGPVPLWP